MCQAFDEHLEKPTRVDVGHFARSISLEKQLNSLGFRAKRAHDKTALDGVCAQN